MNILTKYIFKESFYFFILSFIVFSTLFLFYSIFKVVSEFFGNIQALKFVELAMLFIPASFWITIPMSLLIASLMTLGRLASDSEIIALRANGVSSYQIAKPFILLTAILLIFDFYSINYLSPVCMYRIRKITTDLFIKKNSLILTAGKPIYIKGRKIMIGKIEDKNIFNITMVDNNKDMITAKSGFIEIKDDTVTLILYNGTVESAAGKEFIEYNKIYFGKIYKTFSLDSGLNKNFLFKSPREMSFMELREKLKKENKITNSILFEMYSKISLPFACISFIFIALPLGLTAKKTGKAIGFTWGLLAIFCYYAIYATVNALSLKTANPNTIKYLVWLPNIVMISAGLFLLRFHTLKKI